MNSPVRVALAQINATVGDLKFARYDGDIDPTGEEYSYIKTDETLRKALDDSGYEKPKAKNVGRGVALVQWTPAGGTGTGLLDAHAATVGHGVVDPEQDDGTDDRAEQPGGAEAAVGGVAPEQDVGQEAAYEGPDDAEHDGGADAHGVTAGNQEPGQRTGDEADHEQAEDESDH